MAYIIPLDQNLFWKSHYRSVSGALTKLPNFEPGMVKWCAMHTLNLGVTGWILGSAILEFMDVGVWSGDSIAETWRVAYDAFKSWAQARKIPYLDYVVLYTLVFFNLTPTL